MKQFIYALLILSFCIITDANIVGTQFVGVTATSSYSDIIFYLNCDADSGNAQKAGGSATVTWDAGILLNETDEIVGTGCVDQNNDGSDDFDFEISGNVDFDSGRIGFWFNPQEALTNAGRIVTSIGNDFYVIANTANGNISVIYLGTTNDNNGSFEVGTWTFLEFRFNGTECKAYQDGNLIATVNGTGSVDDTVLSFMAQDANALDQLIDNIISSNNPDRDLYAVRTVTDFS
jgi:hypothetical protein